MEWTPEAEAAIKKVPFFVRKKVRRRVESEASEAGKTIVGLADVKATQKRYLSRMASEIKGYQLDACFGPSGCPNRAIEAEHLVERLEGCLREAGLLTFLKQEVGENLKFHHEFRVTVAECPNACSQPQIKDFGIIGASVPAVTEEVCSECEACTDVCPDDAITLGSDNSPVILHGNRCLVCGKCIGVCPTGTLAEDRSGYRVLLGGKLGRHPRLAEPLPGVYTEADVLTILTACLDFYKSTSRGGKRFAEIFGPEDFHRFVERFGKLKAES